MKKLFKKVFLWFKQNERIIYLEYAFIALMILLPLLKPGYILTLDMVFTPKISMPVGVENNYLLISLLHFLNYVIPSQIIEKIILFLIIFLSGVGMHRLIPTKNKWPKYFAALLYIFNPFVYSRFMAGHWVLLLAYAITPFAVKSILEFFRSPDFKKAPRVIFWLILISIISLHAIVVIFIFFAFAFIFFLYKNIKNKQEIIKTLKFTIFIGLALLILSSYWLVPFFTQSTQISQIVSSFDPRHILGFQTVADKNFGVLFNTAALYGFWGENEGRFVISKRIIPFWYVISIILFMLVIWGIISNFIGNRLNTSRFASRMKANRGSGAATLPTNLPRYPAVGGVRFIKKKRRTEILIFAATAILSFILAVGVAYSPMSQFILWLYQKVPLLKGFREPQKFVALLVLAYAYLGALGVNDLLKRAQRAKRMPKQIKMFLPFIFLVIPLLYSPIMLWGFGGQLKPVNYPKDWYEMNETLKADKEDFRVLFLPWHQYLGFLFAGRVIANPAQNFFEKPVIQGDNMEFGQIYSQSNNPDSKYIEENIIKRKTDLENMGEILLPLDIKYIILAKEIDWKSYDFLDKQEDLKLFSETESLKVYENLSHTKVLHTESSVRGIRYEVEFGKYKEGK